MIVRNIAAIALIAFSTLGAQGCDRDAAQQAAEAAKAATEAQAPAPTPTAPAAPAAEVTPLLDTAAGKTADLAYRYGELSLNAPADYAAAIRDGKGCKVGAELLTAIGNADLSAETLDYAKAIAAKGVAVKDAAVAQVHAQQLVMALGDLKNLCDGGSGDTVVAKQSLIQALAFRSALGLALPKKH